MARKQKTINYLYKTTCLVTSRYYIGMHSTHDIDDGYLGSGKRLRASIRKYGKKNHTKEILEYFDTRELLAEAETNAITEDMIADKNCMNLMGGGYGGFISEEHQTKLSKAGNKAFREKLDNDKEFRETFSKQRSDSIKKHITSGNINMDSLGMQKGDKHTEESKIKMSEASKGKNTGESNGQYGTCWITNGTDNKKINKGDIIPEGWRLGSVMSEETKTNILLVNEKRRKVERPPYEQLLSEIKELGLSGTGRKYGVHYTAIKKWRLNYEKHQII